MLTTKHKPVAIGEILVEEFMEPMGLTQAALAEAMGVQRKHVNELCNNRRAVTAATALILARVFGNSPDFRLNAQRRSDLWEIGIQHRFGAQFRQIGQRARDTLLFSLQAGNSPWFGEARPPLVAAGSKWPYCVAQFRNAGGLP